jgi:hypothetical protein
MKNKNTLVRLRELTASCCAILYGGRCLDYAEVRSMDHESHLSPLLRQLKGTFDMLC